MIKLTPDDFRFLAEKVLNKVDFDPTEYELESSYINDMRDALLEMANSLETKGEFEIFIPDDKPKENDCGCSKDDSKTEKT